MRKRMKLALGGGWWCFDCTALAAMRLQLDGCSQCNTFTLFTLYEWILISLETEYSTKQNRYF